MKEQCVIWGTGNIMQTIGKEGFAKLYDIVAFCDSDRTKQGGKLHGTLIISPEALKALCQEGKVDIIVIGINAPKLIAEIKGKIARELPGHIAVKHWTEIIYPLQNEYLLTVQKEMRFKWDVDFEEQCRIWIENFTSEVEFWVENFCLTYENRFGNKFLSGIDKSCASLEPFLDEGSVVMDIGCGPVSQHGDRLSNLKKVHLLRIDPLAPFYNRLYEKHFNRKLDAPFCQFGLFEFIADFYEKDCSDLILINNALDHCIDPYKSIIECLYVLKKGGRMRLLHRRAEAVFEFYSGLHKWNIDYNGKDDLIVWNKENAINVTESLSPVAEIRLSHSDGSDRVEQSVSVDVIKRKDFELDEFLDMKQERRYLAFFIHKLMEWIADNSPLYTQACGGGDKNGSEG